VDDLVRELVRGAGGSVELAEYGIIFLDEIDKIAGASNMIGRDVSGRGVQSGLLKLLEETEVSVRSPTDFTAQLQDMMQMKRGKTTKRTINTRHILFVASGAFNGLKEIVEKRLSERNVGFGAAAPAGADRDADILAQANTRDFVEYGFEPEFIGRLPVRVVLSDLTEEDLFRILTTSEGSIIKQYQENFSGYGIQVGFESQALRVVAARAMEEKTGARGLMTVLETCLRDFKFHLPGRGVKRLAFSVGMMENPQSELEKLLRDPQAGERAYALLEARRFAGDFEGRHGVGLDFDESSVLMAAAVSTELGISIPEYLDRVFQDHMEALHKLAEGKVRLPVSPQVLHRPGDAIAACLAAHSVAS
jgi:ATP-dependent Clp protease ATP-binding subunit ClpX